MPSSQEPNSKLYYGWSIGESGWNLQMDSNIVRIGATLQLSVLDKDLTADPATPTDGDRYIVGASATGAWAGKDNNVTVWRAGLASWEFYAPDDGWLCYVEDEDVRYQYTTAGGWAPWAGTSVLKSPTATKTGNYTILASDRGYILLVDATSAAVTLTLPDSAAVASGFTIGAVKIDSSANTVTIVPAGTNLIKGLTSLVIDEQWGSTLLDTDGAGQWFSIGGGGGASFPLLDDENLFANATDNTKVLKYDLSGITTATTRTATWPNKSGTVAMTSDITGGALPDFGEDSGTTSGLTWGYLTGNLRVDNAFYAIAAGTILTTASSTNYIELDPADQTVKVNQTAFTTGRIPLREVVTGASTITTSTDKRAWVVGNQVFYGGLIKELPCLDQVVSRPEIKDYAETVSTPVSSAGTLTIDLTAGNVAEVTLTENVTTLNLNNPPATGKAGSLTMILKQDATGSRTVTWPASVKWAGGTAPTLSTAASSIDVLTFVTIDAGTTWYAFLAGGGMA